MFGYVTKRLLWLGLKPWSLGVFFKNQVKLVDWAIWCCCSLSDSDRTHVTFCMGTAVDYSGHRPIVSCGSIICNEQKVSFSKFLLGRFHFIFCTLNILLSPS